MKQTSLNAYIDLEQSGKAGIKRAQILKFLIDNDRKQGYTRNELSQRLNMPINCVCGRVNDLIKVDLIDCSENKVCTVTARFVERLKAI